MYKSLEMKSALLFGGVMLAAQVLFSVTHLLSFEHALSHAKLEIQKRIALDAAYLDLGDPLTQQSVDSASVARYIEQLNADISQNIRLPSLQVKSIAYQNITNNDAQSLDNLAPQGESYLELKGEPASIIITLAVPVTLQQWKFHWIGLFLSAIVVLLYIKRVTAREERRQVRESKAPSAYLRIDLIEKQIINAVTNENIEMQNKPLCFFAALVDYCVEHPEHELLHHKDAPQELVSRANRVFARLIELGHTKRKRPDFNANLEKTLSEIRAALEVVFANNPEIKVQFYPPRAQGEGSRSKQHSYALHHIERDKVEFVGM